MSLSKKAKIICDELNERAKLGDLRTIAKEIKKDHDLAKELWSTGNFFPRLLSILIMDSQELNPEVIENLFENIQNHILEERLQIADWLMANQLTKNKKTIALIESWKNSYSSIQRRLFWYYQGRLRWVGQTPPDNTKELLSYIKENLLKEEPEVQWAMNFTAAWIGIFDRANRSQCIKMGEELGLYKDEVVPKGCSPNYLPKFIELEVKKRKLK